LGICGLCHHYHRHRGDAYVDSNLPSKSQVIRSHRQCTRSSCKTNRTASRRTRAGKRRGEGKLRTCARWAWRRAEPRASTASAPKIFGTDFSDPHPQNSFGWRGARCLANFVRNFEVWLIRRLPPTQSVLLFSLLDWSPPFGVENTPQLNDIVPTAAPKSHWFTQCRFWHRTDVLQFPTESIIGRKADVAELLL
jgi:hypothetical protein